MNKIILLMVILCSCKPAPKNDGWVVELFESNGYKDVYYDDEIYDTGCYERLIHRQAIKIEYTDDDRRNNLMFCCNPRKNECVMDYSNRLIRYKIAEKYKM